MRGGDAVLHFDALFEGIEGLGRYAEDPPRARRQREGGGVPVLGVRVGPLARVLATREVLEERSSRLRGPRLSASCLQRERNPLVLQETARATGPRQCARYAFARNTRERLSCQLARRMLSRHCIFNGKPLRGSRSKTWLGG